MKLLKMDNDINTWCVQDIMSTVFVLHGEIILKSKTVSL